ncbi:GntR family transcriptional regulator [Streptomyces sp. NPDC056690]|uniref:GntR family transcriptional regulator n=1 Tax=unclassified Streptomyces TaxID=2593676 RepID=UPI00363EF93B
MTAGPASSVSGPMQLTLQAAAQIRGLIIEGVLLPGQKIRQVDLSEQIGVSRSPLREALRTLESEGVVTYETNRGYVVARLEPSDLAEIYRMRELLEGELLRSIVKPDKKTLDALVRYNDEMIAAVGRGDIAAVLRANREFHFTIFELSPLNQFKREIQRLWQLSEGYLAWWWRLPHVTTRISQEHKQIIKALRKYDREALVESFNAHRVSGHESALPLLGRS